jgi:hypothetical protein
LQAAVNLDKAASGSGPEKPSEGAAERLPVPNNEAELCIAHAQSGMHRVYDRYGYRDEKRRALELWAGRLAEIIGDGSQSIHRDLR